MFKCSGNRECFIHYLIKRLLVWRLARHGGTANSRIRIVANWHKKRTALDGPPPNLLVSLRVPSVKLRVTITELVKIQREGNLAIRIVFALTEQ